MAVLDRLYQRPVILWGFYALLMTAVGMVSGFAILANDTFPLLFQAEQLSASDPVSWYNGFFPIGYPLLLKGFLVFGRENIDVVGVVFNILASLGLFLLGKKLLDSLDLEVPWKLLALLVMAFLPEVARAVMTIRPDHLAMVLGLGAFVYLRRQKFTLVGLLIGISYLFRSHMLALLAGICILLLLRKDIRYAVTVLLYSVPFIALQGILNVASGESFFSSSQGFNVAKLMYGADWKSEQQITVGTWEIISSDGWRFMAAWLNHLLIEWYLLVIFGIGLFFRSTREFSLIALIYCLIVAAGGSPRGSLPVQPIAIFTLFAMGSSVINKLTGGRRLVPAIVSLSLIVGASAFLFTAASKARARIEGYNELANKLGVQRSTDARRLLTDDFALYFPHQENAVPHVNGGWAMIGVPVYRERVMQFSEQDPALLHTRLRSNNVDHIVLLQPTLDPTLLSTISKDTANFVRTRDISGYAVYTVR